nr:class I SAM-dependent methyltransferase [Cellulomonas denverensis]
MAAAAGTGTVLDSLIPALGARHDYVAIDTSPGLTEVGRRRFPDVHWRVEPVEPVLERLYAELDLITVGQALHRLERDRFLRATRGALRPGGLLAVLQHEAAPDVSEELSAVFGADAVEEVAVPGAARMTLARRG